MYIPNLTKRSHCSLHWLGIGSMKYGFRTSFNTWEETVKDHLCCPQPWLPRTQQCRDLPTICSHLWQVIRSKSKKIQGIWKAATSGGSVMAPISAEIFLTFPAGFNVWTNVRLQRWGRRRDNSWEACIHLLFRLQFSLNAFVSRSEMKTELLVCNLPFIFL